MKEYIDHSLDYRLRLYSKKLNSGNYQVKFQARKGKSIEKYGYLLAKEGSTLKQVVCIIRQELGKMTKGDMYRHEHLYSLGKSTQHQPNLIIFDRILTTS